MDVDPADPPSSFAGTGSSEELDPTTQAQGQEQTLFVSPPESAA